MANKKSQEFVLPSTQSDLDTIASAVKEASDAKVRAAAEADLIKDIAARMKDEFMMPPRVFNKMVRTYFKSEYNKISGEAEEFQETYLAVMAKVDPILK